MSAFAMGKVHLWFTIRHVVLMMTSCVLYYFVGSSDCHVIAGCGRLNCWCGFMFANVFYLRMFSLRNSVFVRGVGVLEVML